MKNLTVWNKTETCGLPRGKSINNISFKQTNSEWVTEIDVFMRYKIVKEYKEISFFKKSIILLAFGQQNVRIYFVAI